MASISFPPDYKFIPSSKVFEIVSLTVEKQLSELNLKNIGIDSKDINFLSDILADNRLAITHFITKIDFTRNSLRAEHIQILAIAFETNRSVMHLDFSFNEIGDEGAKYIGEILKKPCSITYLDISENGITDAGDFFIAEALKVNKTLTHLYRYRESKPWHLLTLRKKKSNRYDIGKVYAEALEQNYTLIKFHLPFEQISKLNDNFNVNNWNRIITKHLNRNLMLNGKCIVAALKLNNSKFKQFINDGVSVLSLDNEGNTFLHLAVLCKNKELVDYLVPMYQRRGILIDNIRNAKGKTARDLDEDELLLSTSTPAIQQKDNEQMLAERQNQWEAVLQIANEKRQKYNQLEKECKLLRQKLNELESNQEEYHKIEESLKKALRESEVARQALNDAEEKVRDLAKQLEFSRTEVKGYRVRLEELEKEKKQLTARLAEINHLEDQIRNDMWAPLFAFVDARDKEGIITCLDKEYNINSIAGGMTVLHRAVEDGIDERAEEGSFEEIIKYLVKRGANPNIKSLRGETPFHRAVRSMNKPIIKLLIEAGANVTIPMVGNDDTIIVLDFIKRKIVHLEVKEQNLEKQQESNYLNDEANEELKKVGRSLKEHKEIQEIVINANKKQDVEEVSKEVEKQIQDALEILSLKYNAPLTVILSRDPSRLKDSPNIFISYIHEKDSEKQKTMEILNSYLLIPKNVRERLKAKIDVFFGEWGPKLINANERAQKLFPSSNSSSILSSPPSMVSRPFSS